MDQVIVQLSFFRDVILIVDTATTQKQLELVDNVEHVFPIAKQTP
jgi:hypothetical protein